MTVGVIVETVYQRVNGNRPSTDNSIIRADIRAVLPAAINYALDAAYNNNIRTEGDRDLPSEFYGFYEDVNILRDGKKPYFVLEKAVVPLKGNQGIRFVHDDCENFYSPLGDADMASIGYWSQVGSGSKWYRRKGNNVELYNVFPTAKKISYQAITSVDALSDDDEAPIQAGTETMVLEVLFNLITKGVPYDNKIDGRDDINAAPYK